MFNRLINIKIKENQYFNSTILNVKFSIRKGVCVKIVRIISGLKNNKQI